MANENASKTDLSGVYEKKKRGRSYLLNEVKYMNFMSFRVMTKSIVENVITDLGHWLIRLQIKEK